MMLAHPGPPPRPNPDILLWARQESGYPVERVARRLQVPEARVEAWESGVKVPTIRQLKLLGAFYQRPLSLFFQAEPPRTVPLAAEHRRLSTVSPGNESPELRLAIRQMQVRRDIALELMDELGYETPQFSLLARSRERPQAVGERLRAAAGITQEQQFQWKSAWEAWRAWRLSLEDLGVLVFMFPKVELSEVRGIALMNRPLPVVAVNTREYAESRAYTAVHEVVHLMLWSAGEEEVAIRDRHTVETWARLERFVEEAASFAVIPEPALAELAGRLGVPRDLERMRGFAQRFRVTPLAMATRLRTSGYLSRMEYNRWSAAWKEYVAGLRAPRAGFASPVSRTLGRGGIGFTRLVLEAYDSHHLNTAQASRYLGLRPDQFDALRERLTGGTAAGAADE